MVGIGRVGAMGKKKSCDVSVIISTCTMQGSESVGFVRRNYGSTFKEKLNTFEMAIGTSFMQWCFP